MFNVQNILDVAVLALVAIKQVGSDDLDATERQAVPAVLFAPLLPLG